LMYHSNPRTIPTDEKPNHPYYAKIHKKGQVIILNGAAPITSTTEAYPETTVIEEWGIQIQLEGQEESVLEAIRRGVAVAVSDGSFQNQAGVAAWMIESETKANRIVGRGRTPGSAEDQSAYHSELFGLWGILHTLTLLTEKYQLHDGRITIACNGLSALKQAQCNHPTEPTLAHYELIGAIQTLKSKLTISLNFEHVRGHQDDGVTMVLMRQAWMNIEMDELAKKTIDPGAP